MMEIEMDDMGVDSNVYGGVLANCQHLRSWRNFLYRLIRPWETRWRNSISVEMPTSGFPERGVVPLKSCHSYPGISLDTPILSRARDLGVPSREKTPNFPEFLGFSEKRPKLWEKLENHLHLHRTSQTDSNKLPDEPNQLTNQTNQQTKCLRPRVRLGTPALLAIIECTAQI